MSEVVDVVTGEVVETITKAEAQRLTTEARNEFKSSVDHQDRGWALIAEAVSGGGHIALGYRSPADYVHTEFDGILAGLDVTARRLAVREMTSLGLPTRAIAPVVGVTNVQVHRDLKSGVTSSNTSPSPQGQEASTAGSSFSGSDERGEEKEQPAEPAPAVVIGIDGKKYQQKQPSRAVPRTDAEKTLNSLQALAAKAAREASNLTAEQIRRVRPKADLWTVGLRESIEVLQHLVNSLNPEENK